jgi:hypothetical protein
VHHRYDRPHGADLEPREAGRAFGAMSIAPGTSCIRDQERRRDARETCALKVSVKTAARRPSCRSLCLAATKNGCEATDLAVFALANNTISPT